MSFASLKSDLFDRLFQEVYYFLGISKALSFCLRVNQPLFFAGKTGKIFAATIFGEGIVTVDLLEQSTYPRSSAAYRLSCLKRDII